MPRTKTGLRWLWIVLLVLLFDQGSKYLAQHHLMLHDPVPVTSFFNLFLAYNKGAAFSVLNSASGWQSWVLGGVALFACLAILIWLYRLSSSERWLGVALALIMGGALGNLTDRILHGHVIDFLDFYVSYWHWPTFNIADSAVCAGAFMLIFEAVFFKKK